LNPTALYKKWLGWKHLSPSAYATVPVDITATTVGVATDLEIKCCHNEYYRSKGIHPINKNANLR